MAELLWQFRGLKDVTDQYPKNDDVPLKPGHVSDGYGKVYEVPKSGYSKVIRYSNFRFRYNFGSQVLEVITEDGSVIHESHVGVGDWFDSPEYWIESIYNDEILPELDSIVNETSQRINEQVEDSPYGRFIGKPLKELLRSLQRDAMIIITQKNGNGFNGRVLQVTWDYADLTIDSVADTKYGVDVKLSDSIQ